MKRFVLFGAMILAFGLAGTTNAQRAILGGYSAVATDDEGVVAAAEFAVAYRAEKAEQEGLTLGSADKAEKQSVAGTNYRLCLTVSLDDEFQQVLTVIYQNLKREYTLKSREAVESCD
jgi:hypothetical protein